MENGTSPPSSVELKGLERLMRISPIRVAHILEVSLLTSSEGTTPSLKDVYERAPKAWRWVTTRHPRMRATLNEKDLDDYVATIRPGSLSDSALNATLRLMDEEESKSYGNWGDYVSEECNTPWRNRNATETMFAMTIMALSPEKAVLILFSDHSMSDGFSGLVVLRDFLHVLMDTPPSSDPYADYTQDPPTSLPLQGPMADKVDPQTMFSSLCNRLVVAIAKPIIPFLLPYFEMMLKSKHLLHDPTEKCTANFATGSRQNLADALQRCRAEKTTLVGPICIAMAMGLAEASTDGEVLAKPASEADADADAGQHVKWQVTIDYNLRNRVGMGKEHVGTNIGVKQLQKYENPGIPLDVPFWEVARDFKEEITKAGEKFHMHFWQFIDRSFLDSITPQFPSGAGSDVNVSNLGRWPFDKQIGPLRLDRLYLYNSLTPGKMDPAVVFFVTSVDSLQYAMSSLIADKKGLADRAFETAVKIVESVGGIGPTTTVREVLQNAMKSEEGTD
mmetsp:Transcript_5628/g.14064  ORF Transcript_5628/g.14064 Transcript_5628/m.14064 type:complete len:505 (-) Transcript_5628:641-2155(-)|eukprot:CAMPEP_0197188516 /NCGR_PEP_ID=MMETSP1423-20130617/17910_1 /TAXON_ID=476441 /ORGANISM="Pseudo-nitzschia heimii, Strain UNC1101" /LENGTH=504 /DNA_ID=CAMNT_0042640363 /DNA_START=101 /DNA_END=1615 /DNA_ORIENTATION=+